MHTVFPAYLKVVSLLSRAVSAEVVVVCFIRTPVIFPNLFEPKSYFVHNEAAFLLVTI